MISESFKIVNKRGICFRPPDTSIVNAHIKNVAESLKLIHDHKYMEVVRVGIIAGSKDRRPEKKTYNGGVVIKVALTEENPKTLYCICQNPSVMSKPSRATKFTWTTFEDLYNGLVSAMKEYPDLRFYLYYLEVLDKGSPPSFPHVIAEFRKVFEFDKDSEVANVYHPEKKSLDLKAVYRNPEFVVNEDKKGKGGYWKKHKIDLIPNIYLHLPIQKTEYVEAEWAKNHCHNLVYLKEVFMVRGCDLKESIVPQKVYQALESGKCYEVDINDV